MIREFAYITSRVRGAGSIAGTSLPLHSSRAVLSTASSKRRPGRLLLASIAVAAVLIACFVFSECYGVERTTITVVHTNDLHSHLSPATDGVEPVGGIARVATLINRIRASEPYVIVLDAGDMFMGTPFFTFYGGKAELECYNAIGYDAVAVGNHELDNGPRALLELEDDAEFTFLSANLARRRSGKPIFEPYLLLETEEDISVAILGLTPGGISEMVGPSAIASLTAKSPVRTAREMIPILRDAADAVIVLSHLGLDDDKNLARQVPGIDLIVGGHSHDLLEKPVKIRNIDAARGAATTYIVQAGWGGTHVGRVDMSFEDGDLAGVEARLIPATSAVNENREVARIVGKYWNSMESTVTEVVARATGGFPRDRSLRTGESPLGNLVADAIRDATGADFAVQNSGGIRSGFGPGPVTVWDVYSALPFDNKLVLLELSGDEVGDLAGEIARRIGRGSFCQVSGVSFEIYDGMPRDIRVADSPLDRNATYTVGTISYLAEGGCNYAPLTNARVLSTSDEFQRDITVEYFRKLKNLNPRTEGRIRIKRGGR
jgi:2',3'-cyclic-nucleotide 2'-phosphodiesterase (5'-nucleotidase family)